RVIALREQFHIPPDSDRFRVTHADATDYLAGMANGNGAADVILLDGFNAYGLPEALSSQSFYDNCYAALCDGGVLVANLLDDDPRVAIHIERIRLACSGKLLCTAARRDGNLIAIGLRHERAPRWHELHARAQAIDASTGLNLSLHVNRMESRHRAEMNERRGANDQGV
ncbi:MAG TPA: spermidine synthase, partial [Paraburkholderia sp.]|nr:spermidine synthase [Paraburkholderia sp.]